MDALAFRLTHLFLPSYSNNQKAKLIHSSTIFFIALLLLSYRLVLHLLPGAGAGILGYASSIPPVEVISLTNQKRAEEGLGALSTNEALNRAAAAKGADMLAKGYWAHVAPDGTEPWKFFSDVGYKYRYAGENLARDFSSPSSTVDAWVASPSHRENLLSSKYTDIGVAVVEGNMNGIDTTIVVQLFGTRYTDTSPQVPIARANTQGSQTALAVKVSPTPLPLTPTPTIALSPTISPTVVIGSNQNLPPGVGSANTFELLISPLRTTRGVTLATTLILIIVMSVDYLYAAKKKIPRIGGRTFAHLAFLGMIAAIIIIVRAGEIL